MKWLVFYTCRSFSSTIKWSCQDSWGCKSSEHTGLACETGRGGRSDPVPRRNGGARWPRFWSSPSCVIHWHLPATCFLTCTLLSVVLALALFVLRAPQHTWCSFDNGILILHRSLDFLCAASISS